MNTLFKAWVPSDKENTLTEKWVSENEAKRLQPIYEAAGYKVIIKTN